MPVTTSRNLSPNAGRNPATTLLHEMPPELLRQLSERGIDIASLDSEIDAMPFVGISSASGTEEDQPAIDAWIAAGGMPEFEDAKPPL